MNWVLSITVAFGKDDSHNRSLMVIPRKTRLFQEIKELDKGGQLIV